MDHITFETERLFLRPVLEKDASVVLQILNTPKFRKFVGDRQVRTELEAASYISTKMLPQLKKLGFGNYAVIRKQDGVLLGTCGLHNREGLEGVDIGFAFLPQYEGQGYAYESAVRLKQAALEDFGIKQILGITSKVNFASQKLLEKLGLKFERMITLPHDEEEILLYRFSAEEE
ncbi:GNAT family N-acetyltransferase [Salinimicrobium flavum]|uniref:GNAT family N-acetyltransferase n=1 Tax=Salinimicrobium flavum TaxID=1737065 RepID=A0ABW5J2H6_9FLAO